MTTQGVVLLSIFTAIFFPLLTMAGIWLVRYIPGDPPDSGFTIILGIVFGLLATLAAFGLLLMFAIAMWLIDVSHSPFW